MKLLFVGDVMLGPCVNVLLKEESFGRFVGIVFVMADKNVTR